MPPHVSRGVFAILVAALVTVAPSTSRMPAVASPPATGGPHLGTTIDWASAWVPQTPFVDLFVTARPWVANAEGAAWGEGGELDLTADGWVRSLQPGQYASTLMLFDGQPDPDGVYTLLWSGSGEVRVEFGEADIVAQQAGRLDFRPVHDDDGIWLDVMATDPADPVRDLHVILPGFLDTWQDEPFHPDFLDSLRPGYEALRFMNWQEISNNPTGTWAERSRPDNFHQSFEVPVEYMVELANTLDKDPWFNVPHSADDDWVVNFFTYVRDHLDPDLRVHIEWSNETWNPDFPQHYEVAAAGMAAGFSDDAQIAAARWHAHRAGQVHALAAEVFGGTDRLVRILATWSAEPDLTREILTWQDAAQRADALAIAAYFFVDGLFDHPEGGERVASLTVDEVLDEAEAWIRSESRDEIALNAALAAEHGLPLVAYEGGSHLTGMAGNEDNEALTERMIEANRHPRMEDLYTLHLQQWEELTGGSLFMAFTHIDRPDQWGSFGAFEYQGQPVDEAPKYRALMAWAGGEPTDTTVTGIEAATPVEVGVAVSRARFESGGASTAVVARDDAFADAVAGAALTAGGPLLFTPTAELDADVEAELRRVLPPGGTVVVLGGRNAVSGTVEDRLRELGYAVDRLAGASRIDTARSIADEVRRRASGDVAALARAWGPAADPDGTAAWADSVASGAWAAAQGVPVLLTPSDHLDTGVASWLDADAPATVVLLGGEAALASVVADRVERSDRVAGSGRAETAAAIATQLQGHVPAAGTVVVVDGWASHGWAAGLAAAGFAAALDAPVLLTAAWGMPDATADLACGARVVAVGDSAHVQTVRSQLAAAC